MEYYTVKVKRDKSILFVNTYPSTSGQIPTHDVGTTIFTVFTFVGITGAHPLTDL